MCGPKPAYNGQKATGLLHLTQFCHGIRIISLKENQYPLQKSWSRCRVAGNKGEAKVRVLSPCRIPVVFLCLG